MAHIERRTLSDGSTAYRVIWTDPSGKRRRRQFSRTQTSRPGTEAKKFLTQVESEMLRGTYVDPSDGQTTFREFAAHYQSTLHQRASSTERLDRILRWHVLPLLGDHRIGAIRRRDVQAMVNALAVKAVGGNNTSGKPLSPGYVRNIYGIVAGIFRAAVLDQVIPASPCVKIALPQQPRTEVAIPTPEQIAAVLDQVAPRYRGLILLAAGSGLRSGELRGLDTDRCRVLERTVRVDRQLLTPDSGGWHYGPPKTAASYRTVPISESYAEAVAAHLAEVGTGADGLIFTARSGQPIRRKTINEHVGPILRSVGLPPRSGMHVFRHYYVSSLIAGGEDILTVMRRAGHATSEETTGTYGHLWPDHATRTRDASEASFPVGRQGGDRGAQGVHRGAPRGPRVTPLSGRGRHDPEADLG